MTVLNGAEWTEKHKKLFLFKFDRRQFPRGKGGKIYKVITHF